MNLLNTSEKRKSILLTFSILIVLVISIFFIGLSYYDPPIEYGIAINFGNNNQGKGFKQPKPSRTKTNNISPNNTKAQQPKKSISTPIENQTVITQNNQDAIAIKNEQERLRNEAEIAKQKKEKEQELARKKAEEEAKKKNIDAMFGGINKAKGNEGNSKGDDQLNGNKGNLNGNPNENNYYGNNGSGGNGDYNLGNRKPLNKPKPDYLCNEEGLVIVRIEVDVNGNVLNAVGGVKGSTNTASCLVSQAEKAALKTKWQPDQNAPSKQFGTIKYRFTISQ
ncbi:MAG: energy transducer TonB [Lutibacter sp.]